MIREKLLTGVSLWMSQVTGLLRKKFLHSIRDWRYFLSTFILPCLVLIFSMFLATMRPQEDLAPLLITPSIYGDESYSFMK